MATLSLSKIQAMDKSDLHVHLDGALPREDLVRIAKEHGVDLDTEKLLHYPDAGPFDAERDFDEFKRFLGCFDLVKAITQTSDGIYETAYSVLAGLKQGGVSYAELRMAPTYHTKGGLSLEQVVQDTLEGMEHARMDLQVSGKLVLAIPREIAYTGDESGNGYTAEDIVAVARNFVDHGVVGIDLACAEHFAPTPYIAAFRSTLGSRLKRYVHAGEAGPDRVQNIFTAVKEMHADAIGHALPLGVDPTLDPVLEIVKDRGIRIERCPLSNLAMSASNGYLDGLRRLLDEEVNVVICSDDPGIFGTTTDLSHNLYYVAQKLSLKWWDVEDLINSANRAGF